MLDQLRLIMEALPWTGPALVGGAALGLVSMALFPRHRSRSDRLGFALLLWCLVLAFVVTLSPVKNSYFGVPTTGCNLSVWQPLNYHYWTASGSRPPNVWLLAPAGIGAMMLDGFWRRFLAIGFLVALPPGVETIQDFYPELKRSCSSQDMVDNWTGLVCGLAVGLAIMLVVGLWRLLRRRVDRSRTMAGGHQRSEEYLAAHEDGRLPLGGGHSGGYDEFADFDDTPNSTRWWSDGASADPSGATQVIPTSRRRDEWREDAPDDHRDQGRWDDERDSGATRVMPTSPRRGDGDGGAGSHRDRRDPWGDDPDADATQIIRRS